MLKQKKDNRSSYIALLCCLAVLAFVILLVKPTGLFGEKSTDKV